MWQTGPSTRGISQQLTSTVLPPKKITLNETKFYFISYFLGNSKRAHPQERDNFDGRHLDEPALRAVVPGQVQVKNRKKSFPPYKNMGIWCFFSDLAWPTSWTTAFARPTASSYRCTTPGSGSYEGRRQPGMLRIWIFLNKIFNFAGNDRDILAGEQIFVEYGYPIEDLYPPWYVDLYLQEMGPLPKEARWKKCNNIVPQNSCKEEIANNFWLEKRLCTFIWVSKSLFRGKRLFWNLFQSQA